MRGDVAWGRPGSFLPDASLIMGRDYLYCPMTKPAVRARLYGFHASSTGAAVTYLWREVLPSGELGERRETLGMFKRLPDDVTLPLSYGNPIVMLRGNLTAALRRPNPVAPQLVGASSGPAEEDLDFGDEFALLCIAVEKKRQEESVAGLA